MSLAEVDNVVSLTDVTVELAIDELTLGESVRGGGLNEAHVALLVEMAGQWSPILVWGEQNLVVDGWHRLAAARRLGLSRVPAMRFAGSKDDAYLESVRRNIVHGLPLSLEDRRRAACRVLERHADWSDRRIAALCGLSGKTVARLRRDDPGAGRRTGVVVGIDRRIGQDGKIRPVRPGDVRDRVNRALDENPGSSLRRIAAAAGASPETVRSVRALREAQGAVATLPVVARPSSSGQWENDPALTSCGDAGRFARWFHETTVDERWHEHVWTIPVGRVYEVVDEARRRAACWSNFATMLESRLRS